MDSGTLVLAALAATLVACSIQAWRLGSEKRDVALLGVVGGLCGLGTAVTVVT